MKVVRETRDQEIWRLSREVEINSVSRNLITYEVKEYLVTFDLRKIDRPWNCTCPHGSLYRGNKDEHCKHIEIVQRRIKEEKKTTW